MNIELSIVTGTVDRPEALKRLLTSVKLHTDISYQMIVVDSGNVAVNYDDYKDQFENFDLIRDYPKKGYTKAYNQGFAIAKGRYVVFLNDDAEVLRSWAIEAVRFMDSNKWCGMGAIYFSEGGINGKYEIRSWLDLPYANFGVISKQLGDRLGWFDDYIYTYGADNSLTFKVYLAGQSITGIPHCKILHHPVMDLNKHENLERQAKDASNLLNRYRNRLPEMYSTYRRYPPARLNG